MRDRTPDIYIVGAQKSGTTTLYDWIAQHPDIYAHPLFKDYPYFSNDTTYHEGLKLFLSFSNGNSGNQLQLGGEANAMYAATGASRIHKLIPNARLIVILRNPVDRAYSAYCYAVERLMENRSLRQAFDDELDGFEYEADDALQRDYLAHGHYVQQLKKLYQFYNPDQVKIIIFEDLKNEPMRAMQEVFQFIGISDDFIPDMEIKNKTKGGYRSSFLAKISHVHPSSKIVRNLGRALIPHSLRTGLRRKLVDINRMNKPKPEFTDDVYKLLVDYYKDEIVELQSLLGRDIFCWHKGEDLQ